MSEEFESIWDGDAWEVTKPPSIPLKLWEQVPEEFRREFIIEAAKKLRAAIHPIYTFEDMLEEKGISFKSVLEEEPDSSYEEEESQPTGKFTIRSKSVNQAQPVKPPISNTEQNVVSNKLWPSKTALNSDIKKDNIADKPNISFSRSSVMGMPLRNIKK